MKHVYEVEADVMYAAKGRRPLWMMERLNVLANGSVNAAMRKARSAFLKLKTEDGSGNDTYLRRATRVKITSVVQKVSVDIL